MISKERNISDAIISILGYLIVTELIFIILGNFITNQNLHRTFNQQKNRVIPKGKLG